MHLLEVRHLEVHFPVNHGWLGRDQETLRAVAGVSFEIAAGESVGLVGESGCGKTTLGRAIVRLVEPSAGQVRFAGRDLTGLRGRELQALRQGFQMIFQDPYHSLDPRLTAGQSIVEALRIHRLTPTTEARHERVAELLETVGLARFHADSYPHELSGGQRQRVGLARALAVKPRLLICDEPVSALDVSVQAQIVNLLRDLQTQQGLAYLFISHDLALVQHFCHRVLVMYLGRVVEAGPAEFLTACPRHPYTQALLSAVPTVDVAARRPRVVLPGEPPSPIHPPTGCPFHPRCPIAESVCRTSTPPLRETTPGHHVACHLVD